MTTATIRARLVTAVLAVGGFVGVPSAQATTIAWSTYWPSGANVQALAIDPATPTTVYAGTNGGGVFKSTNGGGSWSAVNTGITGYNVTALAINPTTPTTLYAGTYDAGIFASTNGGTSWTVINTGLANNSISALAINPTTPTILYAGGSGGFYESTNGGSSWTSISSTIFPVALAINPTTPTTLYAGTSGGGALYESTDGGSSWSAANSGLTDINPPNNTSVYALAINPTTPTTLYAGNTGGNTGRGVYRSTDGGSSWSAANSGMTNTIVIALAIDPMTPTTLYAGTFSGGVFESTNGGSSWSAVNTGLSNFKVQALAINPTTPTTLYAGTSGGGVFESTNGGSSWSGVNLGLPANREVNGLAINPATPTTLYAGTYGGGVYESTNGGSSWSTINTGLTNTHVYALAINPTTPTTLYAGSDGSGVFRSTDGGSSWSAVNTGLTSTKVLALAINPTTPTTLYAGSFGSVFKSTNGGSSWSAVNSGLPANNTVYTLAINPTTPNTLYAGTIGAGVYKSTNGGSNWQSIRTGLTNLNVVALAIDPMTPSTLYAGTIGSPGGGVFKSTSGGSSWSAVNNGLTTFNVEALAIDPTTPATLYAGTDYGGVFQSTNGGSSWSVVSNGLTNRKVSALAINPTTPTTVYAGTASGVFDTRRLVGATCTANNDCPSSNCVDGVCCDADCTGTCQSCAAAVTGQPNGTCAPVDVGLQTSNGCSSGDPVCNGSTGGGSCTTLTAQGQACTSNGECVTANCVDGICCGSTCSNTCQSCNAANTGFPNGTCGSVTAGLQTTNDCSMAGLVCNGSYGTSACLTAQGHTCTANGDCVTGFCIDGVCCDTGCGGGVTSDCQACSAAAGGPTDGTCSPVVCTPLDECHLAGTCDPGTGLCSNPNRANDTTCDDGNACTQTDTCQNGTCTGSNSIVCTPLDQCHVAGACDPSTGLCSNPNQANDTTCNDGNACTQTDTCQNGICTGGNPVVCTPLDQCHVAGTCDPSTGMCSNPPNTDGSACNSGDSCPADTCEAGVCQPVTCPNVDAVVLAGKPLNVTIASGKTEVTRTLRIKVRNADTVDRTIALAVDDGDCPPDMAGAPDFDPRTPVADTSILVPAGNTKTAKMPLTIRSADFTSYDFKAPARCTLAITASAVVAGGSNDPNPSNNQAVVEVNVVDTTDTEETTATAHESLVKSTSAATLTIPSGKSSATKTLRAAVLNADYRPVAETPGDLITLGVSTTCTGLRFSPPVCDPATSSDTVTVKGGTAKICKLTATAYAAQVSTPNLLSPQRCTLTLTATGPTNPETPPRDPRNNRTELVIDVLDKNP